MHRPQQNASSARDGSKDVEKAGKTSLKNQDFLGKQRTKSPDIDKEPEKMKKFSVGLMQRTRGRDTAAPTPGNTGGGGGCLLFLTKDIDNNALDQTYRDTIAHWDQVIHTLEAFNGRYFFNLPSEGTSGGAKTGLTFVAASTAGASTGGGTIEIGDPLKTLAISYNQTQLDFLQKSYDRQGIPFRDDALLDSIYDGLLLQTRLKPYLDAVNLAVTEVANDEQWSEAA
jgi:hypothetical protein